MKILVDTDWFAMIKDLAPNKQQEVIDAILDYPNKESDTHLWKTVIKPTLETGRIKYFNQLNNLKQYKSQKSGEKNSESESESDTEPEIKEKKRNNSWKGVCLLDTTRTRAGGKTVEEILQEATRNLSSRKTHTVLITPDFTFPHDMFFNAYRQELPTATTRTEQWLRRSNLVGKMVSPQKLAQIIRKFATEK